MAERRHRVDGRSKRQKLAAVLLADMVGVTQAGEETGIPKTTIQYWLDRPEFVPFRTRAREDLAAEITAVAHLAWTRVAEGLEAGAFEPRDILTAAEKSAALMQLLSGEPTSRTETRALTDGMDDHEREALRLVIDDVLKAAEVT